MSNEPYYEDVLGYRLSYEINGKFKEDGTTVYSITSLIAVLNDLKNINAKKVYIVTLEAVK